MTDNFDTQSFRQIPFAPRAENELNLTQLRRAVQSQGRLRDARLILAIESGFLSGEDAKCGAWRSLIEACRHANNNEPVWAVESTARSMLAQSLRRAGDSAAAEKETQLAVEVAEQAVSQFIICIGTCLVVIGNRFARAENSPLNAACAVRFPFPKSLSCARTGHSCRLFRPQYHWSKC